MLAVASTVAAAAIISPQALRWMAAAGQAGQVGVYTATIQTSDPDMLSRLIGDAETYNRTLGPNIADNQTADTGHDRYETLLDVGADMIGRLTIPAIRVDLGIYHDADDDSFARGVGHIFGSSLPVGGPGTNSVLAAHSGLLGATMFTDLRKLVAGDTFTVSVAGRNMVYMVESVTVVPGDDRTALTITPGVDAVTLMTCTPINVNSHRLLVRGVRVPGGGAGGAPVPQMLGGLGAGFPWWLAWFVAGAVAVTVVSSVLLDRVGARRARRAAARS